MFTATTLTSEELTEVDLEFYASFARKEEIGFACQVYDYRDRSKFMSELNDQDSLWKILAENERKEAGLLDRIYEGYENLRQQELVDPEAAALGGSKEICRALFDFYFSERNQRENALTLSEMHGLLEYRRSNSLWRDFLELGLSRDELARHIADAGKLHQVHLVFLTQSAEIERRFGNSRKAETDLRQIIVELGNLVSETVGGDQDNRPETVIDRGLTEYQLAYSIYLQGRLGEAAQWMRRSAETSASQGDGVGEWISKSLEFRFAFLAGECSARTFIRVMELAKTFFQANSTTGKKARAAIRWKWNALQHIIEGELENGNARNARAALDELIHQGDGSTVLFEEILELQVGSVAFLEGNYPAAEAAVGKFISGRDEYIKRNSLLFFEASSQPHWLLGRIRAAAGDFVGARSAFGKALAFEDEPANHWFKARARTELEAFELESKS